MTDENGSKKNSPYKKGVLMKKESSGFTLVEILVAMSILSIGLTGILILFPVGLSATQKAIESSNSTIIIESVHASLKAAINNMSIGKVEKLQFFHAGVEAQDLDMPVLGSPIFIPGPNEDKFAPFAALGFGEEQQPRSQFPFNFQIEGVDTSILQQYSFSIEIRAKDVANLYEVIIRVQKGGELIKQSGIVKSRRAKTQKIKKEGEEDDEIRDVLKKFRTQITLPTPVLSGS